MTPSEQTELIDSDAFEIIKACGGLIDWFEEVPENLPGRLVAAQLVNEIRHLAADIIGNSDPLGGSSGNHPAPGAQTWPVRLSNN